MTAIWQCLMAISITTARRHDPASFIRHLRALDVHTQAGYEDWPRHVLIVWSKWIDDQKMSMEHALLFDFITRSFRDSRKGNFSYGSVLAEFVQMSRS
jgi:hypothetical protein